MERRNRAAAAARWLATVLAGTTALLGAGAAALVLLPPLSWNAWQYGLLVLEFSLVFAVLAVFGLALALAAAGRPRPRTREGAGRNAGARSTGAVWRRRLAAAAAAANGAVLVAALVPPASVWSAARAEGARLDLGEYAAGLATSADRAPETRVYLRTGESAVGDASDPQDLELDVWEPAEREGEAPLPIVVNVHGGAEDLPQSLLPRWDAWLADSGHVVFDVDYRYFPDGDWSVPVSDVKCAIGWAREHAAEYGADPGRVAVTGQSAGGLLALLAGYSSDEEIPPSCDVPDTGVDAVAAWYSVADGTAGAPEVPWRQRHSPMGEDLLEESERLMGGSLEELPEEYAMSSPITYVSPEVPPTLLIMPGHDLFLGPEDNRRLAARLDAAGVPHRLLEIPWAEHMFDLNWGGFASQVARHGLDGFLDEHLAPSP
ncbi:alpha/beta hydrolase [Nocardiopsis alborubida]|uniref:Alpha/beta hydrolase n=1 Tax=Nocardiopsis alborubida TaxID=146802 RepID=A0A7X6MJH0_9ACTN|nr:alpha/beta hydrolase [Nocardiopsis alborubida]NKZ01868.1 alpha/beta hydrolase [Nocardiopsis alborubida]